MLITVYNIAYVCVCVCNGTCLCANERESEGSAHHNTTPTAQHTLATRREQEYISRRSSLNYEVATISMLLKMICLFCRISSLL